MFVNKNKVLKFVRGEEVYIYESGMAVETANIISQDINKNCYVLVKGKKAAQYVLEKHIYAKSDSSILLKHMYYDMCAIDKSMKMISEIANSVSV